MYRRVIGELATLNTVVRSFQFDGIVGSVHEMQTEEDPVIAGNEQTALSDVVLIAVAIQELLLEIKIGASFS